MFVRAGQYEATKENYRRRRQALMDTSEDS